MNKLKILFAFALAFAFAFAGTSSFAAEAGEDIIGKYGAITIKTVDRTGSDGTKVKWTVAYIDDSSDETPVIPEDIQVDSVYYSREFKNGVPSTLMLPFDAPTGMIGQGLGVFEFIDIVKDDPNGTYRINVRSHYSKVVEANTPYVVISEGKDYCISFHMEYQQPDKITFNTTTNTRNHSFSSGGYNWNILGTYERIEFKNPKGIYGFAAKEKNKTKIGDFTKAACSEKSCAYIRPFRAYLKCTLPKASQVRGLAKSADDVASLDDLPKNIEVHVIEDNGGRTYLGTLNTYTGEITVEDRWFDMKGRRLQQKPTAKGTYFNNKKKVVIK